jgi:L-ornithine N5-monooxygenase
VLDSLHSLQVSSQRQQIPQQAYAVSMAPGILIENHEKPYDSTSLIDKDIMESRSHSPSAHLDANDVERLDHQMSKANTPREIHDLVCVGFGPASLAIAVALHDALSKPDVSKDHAWCPKVRFIEKQSSFQWHAGMLLPSAKMQISFIKDLATLRDPTSHFTFLNYLKERGRLVHFTNLGTFLPSRLEFNDYLQWAAEHFEGMVDYGQEVQSIRPHRTGKAEKFDVLEVHTRGCWNGALGTFLARNVVIAAGGQPAKPAVFPTHQRIIHSSQYHTKIEDILDDQDAAYRIAVVGGGQSAAEVFSNLQERYPRSSTRLIFRDSALRPSDDSPFVNEVFNPEVVDDFNKLSEDSRLNRIRKDKATNYSVVRLELLERIYHDLYIQRIRQSDESQWQHRLMPLREVAEVSIGKDQASISLVLRSLDPSQGGREEDMMFDAVVLATGYRRTAHNEMLRDCQFVNADSQGGWIPRRDYSLPLDRKQVANNVNIWTQGCNEQTHGLSDSLLSVLATRSGELVKSIFGVF